MKIIRRIIFHDSLIACCISIFAALLSTSKYIAQLIRAPSNHVFVGMSQYFEDFYYYLDQFYQGAHGGWLTHNNFSVESFQPTLVYINHILLGKIGGLFGLEAFTSYNLSLLILKFIFLMLSYRVLFIFFPQSKIKRLLAFMLFIFSTSFPIINLSSNSPIIEGSLYLFRMKNTFRSRFGNVPNPLIENILFTLLVLTAFKWFEYFQTQKKVYRLHTWNFSSQAYIRVLSLGTFALMIWLSLTDFVKSGLLYFVFCTGLYYIYPTILIQEKKKQVGILLGGLLFGIIIPTLVLGLSVIRDPVYSLANTWDYQEYLQQIQLLNFATIIQSIGPLGILTLGGLFVLKRKRSFDLAHTFVTSIVIFSYLGFFVPRILQIPIPGFRFILSATYLFESIIAVHLLSWIAVRKSKAVSLVIVLLFFLSSAVTIYPGVLEETRLLVEPDYHFSYIPNDMWNGFMVLRALPPKDAIAIANPVTAIDLMIPGFSGKRTYTGHFLTSYNSQEKDEETKNFFYEWNDPELGLRYLQAHGITYIVHTKYTGSFAVNDLQNRYPFLKEVYRNPMMVILTY